MTFPISLEQKQKVRPNLKQMQRLIMSPQMQQALHFLQLPIMELSTVIEEEMEQNPVLEEQSVEEEVETEEEIKKENEEKSLEFNDRNLEILNRLDEEFRDFFSESQNYKKKSSEEDKLHTFLESNICAEETLFEHLMAQAKETFSCAEEIGMAEAIIGNLDRKGFLTTQLSEIGKIHGFEENKLLKVLEQIQTFDPYGVGAENLQQALLIQLRNKGKENSLAYKLLQDNFKDLLTNHLPQIQRALGCTLEEIKNAIHEDIAKLDLHPGTSFSHEPVQAIVPDVAIKLEGEELKVYVNEDCIPNFQLNRKYLRMLKEETLSKEEKEFIRGKVLSAKWLIRNLYQRNESIERIAHALARRQKKFFMQPNGKLEPLTMKELADELDIHESTIARTVANKYVDSPRGLISLRDFFTNAYSTAKGEEISSSTVRDLLQEIIRNENKLKPFSDEAIAKQIQARGIPCARRTVAKYRIALKIGNAHQRRKW